MNQSLSVIFSLLSAKLTGALCVFLMLLFCFILVHIVKLAILGYDFYKNNEKNSENAQKKEEETEKDPPPPPEKKPSSPLPAPIYYLVEKKRVRKKPKQEYEEPKRINFDE